jgi:hypothetical protein
VILQRAGDPNEPGVGPLQLEIAVALADLTATLARCAADIPEAAARISS